MKNNLISGFSSVRNLIDQTNKHSNYRNRQPEHIRYLKEKDTHTEKLILIKIDRDFDNIIKNINRPIDSTINYFIINIASYRHMCSGCLKMTNKDDPLWSLLMGIREKINRHSKQENINIKVIFSGIAAGAGEKEPKFPNCRTPINIAEDHHRALYLIQNPFRPLSYKDYDGNWMTTLVLNSNYLAYEGDIW